MFSLNREIVKFIVLVVIILLIPILVHEGYLLNVMVFVGIHTILALALNLLLGYAGQISLGQAGFFGLGAYISGILTATHGINPWLAMLAAAVVVTLIAFIVGFPILKLKGHYLAMATLGLGIIIYIVFNEAVDRTGGPSGLSGIPNLSIAGFTFDSDLKNYYLIWGFTLVSMGLSLNLVHSRIGRALRAIHDSEVAARVMGVNARVLKVQIFALSAGFSAIAGSLYAHTMTFIAPASFGFNFSVELVTMVIIGGLASIYGSLLGAALLTVLPEMLRAFQDYDIIVYGLLLVLMTMFMPGGLVKGIPDAIASLRAKSRKKAATDA
jgi:branched-chain amino acid transport system permease protein